MANPIVNAAVTDIVAELGGTPPTDLDPTRSRPAHWPGKIVYRSQDYQPGDTDIQQDPYVVISEDIKQAINVTGDTKYVDASLTTVAVSTAAGDATTPYFCLVMRISTLEKSLIHQSDIVDLTAVKALVGTIATPWTNPTAPTILPFVGRING